MIKKRPSHGARHGPTERQRIYHKAHKTLRKANKKGHKTKLDRFLNSPRCRDSQTNVGWDEFFCAAYDVIASEDHSCIATRWERSRNENSWELVLDSGGANGLVDQRDDNEEAKKTCDMLYREYAATARYVNTRIHPQDKFDKDQNNNSKDMKRILTELMQKRDGNITFLQLPRVLLLHHPGGDHPIAGGQHGTGTLHHGLHIFWNSDVRIFAHNQKRIPCKRR